jgi:hypothetical protein
VSRSAGKERSLMTELGEGGNAEMRMTGLFSSSSLLWNTEKGDTSSVDEDVSGNPFCFELLLESEPNGNLAMKPPPLMPMLPWLAVRAGVVGTIDEEPKENLLRSERMPDGSVLFELKFKFELEPNATARPPWLALRISADGLLLLDVVILNADEFELEPITGNDGELERPRLVRIPEKERRCLGGGA